MTKAELTWFNPSFSLWKPFLVVIASTSILRSSRDDGSDGEDRDWIPVHGGLWLRLFSIILEVVEGPRTQNLSLDGSVVNDGDVMADGDGPLST